MTNAILIPAVTASGFVVGFALRDAVVLSLTSRLGWLHREISKIHNEVFSAAQYLDQESGLEGLDKFVRSVIESVEKYASETPEVAARDRLYKLLDEISIGLTRLRSDWQKELRRVRDGLRRYL